MTDRTRELAEALAFDPWVDSRVQKVATDLLKKWAKEDARAASHGESENTDA